MQCGCLGDVRQQSTNFLVVFGRGGLVVFGICIIELARLGEELCRLVDTIKLIFYNLIHLLEFYDVDLKLQGFGQAHDQVFWRLDIF